MSKRFRFVLVMAAGSMLIGCANFHHALPTAPDQVPADSSRTNIKVDPGDGSLTDDQMAMFYIRIDLNQGLQKSRSDLAKFRLNKCQQVCLQFCDTTYRKRLFAFALVNGACSGVVKVPLGFKYFIATDLEYLTKCPWDSTRYCLNDQAFWAHDTVDCRTTKISDTLNFNFVESGSMAFFISVQDPPGTYVEGSRYQVFDNGLIFGYTDFPDTLPRALYSGGKLFHCFFTANVADDIGQMKIVDQKGDTVTMGFTYDINTLIPDGVVKVSGANIVIGSLTFEFKLSLIASGASEYYGGIRVDFNKINTEIYPKGSLFHLSIKGADSVDIDSTGTVLSNIGFFQWHPKTQPKLPGGNYSVVVSGATDEYDSVQVGTFKAVVTIPK